MEWLHNLQTPGFRLWMVQSIVVFFFVGGLALLAAGLALIVNSAAALRFFDGLNRWVSLRRATRPLEIPRDSAPLVQRWRYVLALLFMAGGAVAIVGLVTRFDAGAVITLLSMAQLRPAYAAWLVDAVRWVLVVGNLVAIVIGLLLAFYPETLVTMEARGSRWFSQRQAVRGADAMHNVLDHWVERHPRAAGGMIVVFALGLIGGFGLLLPALW